VAWKDLLTGLSGISLRFHPFAICIKVANVTGGTLDKGTPVYISGWSTTYKAATVAKADADDPALAAQLVLGEAIANNKLGEGVLLGVITGLNTNSYSAVGSPAYLSNSVGTLQTTAPTGADQIVQMVGRVKVKSATIGEMFVFPMLQEITKRGTSALQDGSVSAVKLDPTLQALYAAFTGTAGGTIPAYRLVGGNLQVGTAGSRTIIGANADNAQRTNGQTVNLVVGKTTVVAAEPVTAGAQLKPADNGRVACLNNADKAGGTIKQTAAGSAFANQPNNDQLTLESSNAADTDITVTVIGTTTGGVVTVVEAKALDGTDATTAVDTVKTDWGYVLALKLNKAAQGNIIVKEKSGGLTVATITAGQTSLGVNTVAAADQGAHNCIPEVVCSGTGTKLIGIQYTAVDGSTVAYQTVALNGTTAAAFATAALLVTEVYSGDLEAARTATVKASATEDDENIRVGKALAAATSGNVAALVLP
jgi:hypothetical protein